MSSFSGPASHEALKARAKLLSEIRRFFADRGVLEVETPVLSIHGNSDPAIKQIVTGSKPLRWLRSSPEYAMKRLLASGLGDCYELGRVFREGESGAMHNPEFTLLEWYRLDWDYHQLMDETAELVQQCARAAGKHWPVQKIRYAQWFEQYAGVPANSTHNELIHAIERAGIRINQPQAVERDELLDILVSHVIQPRLPDQELLLVYEYPASQAALARLKPDCPTVAERFELFIGPIELANGYQELTDGREQKRRFEAENRQRQLNGDAVVPLDEHFLAALDAGLPECSGVALGVDRLLLACKGLRHLDQVLAIPYDRA